MQGFANQSPLQVSSVQVGTLPFRSENSKSNIARKRTKEGASGAFLKLGLI